MSPTGWPPGRRPDGRGTRKWFVVVAEDLKAAKTAAKAKWSGVAEVTWTPSSGIDMIDGFAIALAGPFG